MSKQAMREEAESHGPIRYLINTENHVDHIFGNYWFQGAGEIVNHKALWDIFMDPNAALDPFAYALEAIPTDDPDGFVASMEPYAALGISMITMSPVGDDPVAWTAAMCERVVPKLAEL